MAIEFHRPIVKTLVWPDEKHTRDFAQSLALRVQAGGSDLCASITLEGDLGTGKTTLVRHLLQALGVAGRIKSPTYAVVEPYSVAGAGAEPLAFATSLPAPASNSLNGPTKPAGTCLPLTCACPWKQSK
jgi:tRNA threonylcarbamoyladenosine biosynthesis protein TsaE